MSKKITELPATSRVDAAYFIPIVNTDSSTTEKATFTQVVSGLNGLVATLTGSVFSGPVTASLGLSSSFVTFGPSPSSTGYIRTSGGALMNWWDGISNRPVIAANNGTGELELGAAASAYTKLQGYTLTLDSYAGSTFTGAKTTFNTPVTASLGLSSSFVSFGSSPSATGYIRTSGGALINWWDGNSNRPVIFANNGTSELVLGAAASGYTKLQGYTLTLDSYAGTTFTSTPAGAPTTFNTPVTASLGLWVGGNNTITLAHSGSTIQEYDSRFRITDLKETKISTSSLSFTLCSYLSGVNGRTYAADAIVTAKNAITLECYRAKHSAHFVKGGVGTMTLVMSDTSLTSSYIITSLSSSLGTSSGNIVVNAVGHSTGTFYWGVSLRVQEVG